MDFEEEQLTKPMKKTELIWDKYIKYLIEAIDESKFMKRSEIKPMSTPKADSETHLTTRSTHSRMAANIAKRLAEGLRLNENYIYAGMLMHDAGHPFSAHEGEIIFSIIGQLYNCGFFHHNAKGVEVVNSEDILGKALSKIPNIENNEALRKQLEEEFYYFLDVIISHDGEATRKERRKEATHYDSIKDAVKTKLTHSNSYDDYKFVAQTCEGRLAKMADVIAYLGTDILDGFRAGIIDNFDDDYLEIFGQMFTADYSLTKEENIACARNILQEIKVDKVKERKSDIKNNHNQSVLRLAMDVISNLEKKGININSMSEKDIKSVEEIIAPMITKMRANENTMSEEEKQFLNADISKLRDFVDRMITVHSDVVQEVTTRMQEYFINDILANSQGAENAQFSPRGENLFDRLRTLNYQKIVQFSKWDYQTTKQPEAAKKLIDGVAKKLIETGAIRDMFFDRSIREQMSAEARKYANVRKRDEGEYLKSREKIGIRTFKDTASVQYTNKDPKKARKYKLYRDAYFYTQKEGQSFVTKYENVYMAIPTTVRKNVDLAFDEDVESLEEVVEIQKQLNEYKGKTDEEKKEIDIKSLQEKLEAAKANLKTKNKSMLLGFQQKIIKEIRAKAIKKYGSLEQAKQDREAFITDIVQEERENMEEKMAVQLAIDYVSGMTDRGFNDLAISTGYMKSSDISESVRGLTKSDTLAALIKRNKEEIGEGGEER